MIYKDFIENGYKVFGLFGGKDGKCECGDKDCKNAFKHPRIKGWQRTPEWSDPQVEAMEKTGDFKTGYGVLVDGLLVIDVDARNGGVESFKRLNAYLNGALDDCKFAVKTGSGNGSKHLYFLMGDNLSLVTKHKEYKGIDFKSSGYVVGPGSHHASGDKYEVLYGSIDDISKAPDELISLIKQSECYRGEYKGSKVDINNDELIDMLSYIRPDCDYDTWLRIGMAVHNTTNGAGFGIWDSWSSSASNYPGSDVLERKWHSFGKGANSITIGTVVYYAKFAGWERTKTFRIIEESQVIDEKNNDLPCDISAIDVLRPPGFVGEVCKWINDQCKFKRESLAVAGALVSIGNIGGLKYADGLTRVTSNLFAFCIAESSTGKESILQAVTKLHMAASFSSAVHGNFKSEQEIVRNIIRNQAAFYIIDELGIALKKIINASKKGTAAYLEGIIGELMKIYSKANGHYLITGDMKEELTQGYEKTLEKVESGDGDEDAIEAIKTAIASVKFGIKNPFLSVLGFSTGSTFNGLCTDDQAKNGFIGRSLLINEPDSNPKPKSFDFNGREMPEEMNFFLKSIASGGYSGSSVRNNNERIYIPTTDEGLNLLERINNWIYFDYAETCKDIGMEAIARRGYELILKISLILAIPEGVRDIGHIAWAFAVVKADMEYKIRLVFINSNKDDDTAKLKIINCLGKDVYETCATIANKCRPTSKEAVQKALDKLVDDNRIEWLSEPHKRKKTVEVIKYRLKTV